MHLVFSNNLYSFFLFFLQTTLSYEIYCEGPRSLQSLSASGKGILLQWTYVAVDIKISQKIVKKQNLKLI